MKSITGTGKQFVSKVSPKAVALLYFLVHPCHVIIRILYVSGFCYVRLHKLNKLNLTVPTEIVCPGAAIQETHEDRPIGTLFGH